MKVVTGFELPLTLSLAPLLPTPCGYFFCSAVQFLYVELAASAEIEPTAATGSERARTETTEAAMRREREDTRRDCGVATDFVPSSHERCRFVTRSRPCRPDRPGAGAAASGPRRPCPARRPVAPG